MRRYASAYIFWAVLFIVLPLVLVLFMSFNGAGTMNMGNTAFPRPNSPVSFNPFT